MVMGPHQLSCECFSHAMMIVCDLCYFMSTPEQIFMNALTLQGCHFLASFVSEIDQVNFHEICDYQQSYIYCTGPYFKWLKYDAGFSILRDEISTVFSRDPLD